jgi:pyruvate dehydrogenase E1 component alpha subunit
MVIEATELLDWYRQMRLIRIMEERLAEASLGGELPGPVHTSVGQEAVAVGVLAALSPEDWVASTHRGHGHFLARGGDPRSLTAEVYGRATGICRGRGGSMHVADLSKGMLGAQGIVGAGIGIGTGAAVTEKIRDRGAISIAFFGDGGSNQGLLLEALNLAAVWSLPLLLICENNGWSEFTASDALTAGVIAERGEAMGVPGVVVDGNDVIAVNLATEVAVERARSGQGPTLMEMRTYRTRGHVETESAFLSEAYRSDEDVAAWRERDPVGRFIDVLEAEHGVTKETLASIDRQATETVDDAIAFALASPFPDVPAATGTEAA